MWRPYEPCRENEARADLLEDVMTKKTKPEPKPKKPTEPKADKKPEWLADMDDEFMYDNYIGRSR